MKLSNEELKKLHHSVLFFEETGDGYLQAFQYSKEQMAYFQRVSEFWYERTTASCGKSLELVTDATSIAVEYKFLWRASEDSIELFVDHQAAQIIYTENLPDRGELTFALEPGRKKVVIYLPTDATVVLRNFRINGEYAPVEKAEKVLWLGDSITQGYGSFRSGQTYVNVANRILNYDVLNQGIGGYIYDKNSLLQMEGFQPDKIIVALGTNQYTTEDMSDIETYYETITKLYAGVPILCISPLWRGDQPEQYDIFLAFCDKVKEIAGRYETVTVIDGFGLVPHLPEYFVDKLHPNQLGAEVYGRNLAQYIKERHL